MITLWEKIGINKNWQGRFRGKVDLHFHSRFSDGNKTVSFSTMCQIAKYYGLETVALTDHNTIDGLGKFIKASRKHSLPVITGIEMNTSHKDWSRIHTLGYGFDIRNEVLRNALANIQQKVIARFRNLANWANSNLRAYQLEHREIRFPKIVEEVEIAITDEEVEQILHTGSDFSRMHLAKLLVEKNFFPTLGPALDFFRYSIKLYSPPALNLTEAIEIVHQAGGLIFMGHPFGGWNSPEKLAQELKVDPHKFIEILLQEVSYDGIEILHAKHSWKQINWLKSLARKNGMLMSGGSDTHWEGKDYKIFGVSPRKALSYQPWMRKYAE